MKKNTNKKSKSKNKDSEIKISFLASSDKKAKSALKIYTKKYGHHAPKNADVIVTLGGDGFLLEQIHKYIDLKVPFFPINYGSLGFLSNTCKEARKANLVKRIKEASKFKFHPLSIVLETKTGRKMMKMALNEFCLIRQTRQTAHLKIKINNKVRMQELIGDGLIVATPIGSTAYNLSAGGKYLPLQSRLLSITPICSFRPRNWAGVVMEDNVKITLEVLDYKKRSVKAEMDFADVKNIKKAHIISNRKKTYSLLFDKNYTLEEKVLEEQFPNIHNL